MTRWPLFALLAALAAAPAGAAEPSGPLFVAATSPAGIPFWYRQRTDLPEASIAVGWPDGLGMATPGKEALFLLAPSLLGKGAGERSANEMNESLNDLGADADIRSDEWSTTATLAAAPDKLEAAAAIAATALADPKLGQKELDRLRKAAGDRIRQGQTQGETIAFAAAARFMYGDAPMLRRLDPAALDAITREDVDMWRKRVLARQGMVVAASGAPSAAEFGRSIDVLLAGLPEKSDLPPVKRPAPAVAGKTIVVEKELAQTIILEIADTGLRQDREQLQSSVAVTVLGGGLESRLSASVRQKLGASYGLNAGLSGLPEHKLLGILGPVGNDKALEALEAIGAEYARWRADGITAEEFEAARKRIGAQIAGGYAKVGVDTGEFVGAMLVGRPPNDTADAQQRLDSYTMESVNAAVRAKFSAPPLLTVIVSSKAEGFKADCVIKDWREAAGCR